MIMSGSMPHHQSADPYAPHWALYPKVYYVKPVPPLPDDTGIRLSDNQLPYGPDQINGDLTKPVWQHAPWSSLFGDIQGADKIYDNDSHAPAPTQFKALYDKEHLYIAALLAPSPDFATQAHFTERNAPIYQKDSDFEVFVDVWNEHHQYKELELNAINTVWNLLMDKPYIDGGGEHSGRIAQPGDDMYYDTQHQVTAARVLRGQLNDETGGGAEWCTEMALAYRDLYVTTTTATTTKEDENKPEGESTSKSIPPPRPGDIWRINFSRVELQGEVNWTWQPQVVWDPAARAYKGKINMHLPDAWGILVFVDNDYDENDEKQKQDLDRQYRDLYWPLRIAGMNLYYAQQYYKEEIHPQQQYATSLEELLPYVDQQIIEPFDIELVTNMRSDKKNDNDNQPGYLATVRERPPLGTRYATIRHDRLLKVFSSNAQDNDRDKDDVASSQ